MKRKETFTQQKNTSMLIWFWMILLVLHEGKPYSEVKGTTCQEIIKLTGYQTRLQCTGKDMRYHCLLDGNYTVEYEACREWKWIPKGKCAYFNTYGSGNVDERDCESTPDLPCAVKEYNSADNTNYAACYVKKEMTTVPVLETRVVNSSAGENSSLGQTTPTNSIQDEQSHPGSALGITFGVFVPIILVVAAVLLIKCGNIRVYFRKECNEEEKQDIEKNLKEAVPLLSNENNVGNQQIENGGLKPSDASSSEDNTRDTEFDVKTGGGPTVEANSTDNMSSERDRTGSLSDEQELYRREESVGEKEGSTDENDKIKESAGEKGGLTDDEQGTTYTCDENKTESAGEKGGLTGDEQGTTYTSDENNTESAGEKGGLKEDEVGPTFTSDENKTESASENIKGPVQSPVEDEPSDVFDDTVESLQKETVDKKDEKFCEELFGFLSWVFLTPARELLKYFLSKHVEKSPAEVLKDSSVQSELKQQLPPEFHASISPDSEDNDSVIILYYLLRKYLEEKDAPKSGWDKPVKSTDTGIGDDVERLHRVHTIIREISDHGKIPVEGYQRLLSVVCDAFTRLDSDEKFKDDRNQLHKKLQDIRNRRWLPEKLSNMYAAVQSYNPLKRTQRGETM